MRNVLWIAFTNARLCLGILLAGISMSSCAPHLITVNLSKLSGTSNTVSANAPSFSGLAKSVALSSSEAHLSWTPATDTESDSSEVSYEICQSTTQGVCSSSFSATYTVSAGQNTYKVTGLTPGQNYYFVVRAKDPDGNRDTNTQELARTQSSTIRSLAPGGSPEGSQNQFMCAVSDTDEKIRCWGDGYGSLSSPTLISSLDSVAAVATGSDSVCALKEDATVWCWGGNTYGQLGNASNTVAPYSAPVQVSGITNATAITGGRYFYCAIVGTGSIKCWGQGTSGQLGNNAILDSNVPVNVSGITTATRIDAGYMTACAVLANSQLHCWGYNNSPGMVGVGTTTSYYTTPQYVSSLGANVSRISFGYYHACAVLTGGGVRCWGYNTYGALGNGTTTTSTSPVTVTGITTATEVAAFANSACARLSAGTVQCWGLNDEGQLGNGSTTNSTTAVNVTGLTGVTTVIGTSAYVCALLTDGTYSCWGSNDLGPIADNTSKFSYPIKSPEFDGATSFGSGGGKSDVEVVSCAVNTDDKVYCVGANRYGALGNGSNTDSSVAVQVTGITNAVQVAVSGDDDGERACAVLADGKINCWGNNDSGQLGRGNYTSSNVPVQVTGITTATQVSLGWEGFMGSTVCALLSGGTVSCWGAGDMGQLGNGSSVTSNTPVSVSGITNAVSVSTGDWSSCAALSTGQVKCWGTNANGGLGDGTTTDSNTPVTVSGITNAVSVAVGNLFACAALADGTAKCWGKGTSGQLGNGGTTSSTTPVTVSGLSGVTQLSASSPGTCARTSSGKVYCWGHNFHQQFGGTAANYSTPNRLQGIADATSVHVSEQSTCVLNSSGNVRCLGNNDYSNALGLEAPHFFTTPIPLTALIP